MGQLDEAARVWRAEREEGGPRRYREESRLRLGRILDKKFKTAFVGALDRFEQAFGHLWGKGKPTSALTESERLWQAKWREVREGVLDNGNNQARGARSELSQYEVEWTGNRLEWPAAPDVDIG